MEFPLKAADYTMRSSSWQVPYLINNSSKIHIKPQHTRSWFPQGEGALPAVSPQRDWFQHKSSLWRVCILNRAKIPKLIQWPLLLNSNCPQSSYTCICIFLIASVLVVCLWGFVSVFQIDVFLISIFPTLAIEVLYREANCKIKMTVNTGA